MLSEFDIIRRFFTRPGEGDGVRLGIGDDAAVIASAGRDVAVAVDALVAGVHFPISTPPRAIGHRALAVNLSDLAAMGARPRWATLALSLPGADETWLADFAAGFFELADRHGVTLIGGDTVRGPLQVTVQILGTLDGEPLRRRGGRPGDAVYVSGTVGDAAAGLRLFGRGDDTHPLAQRFLFPTPRVDLGEALVAHARACIDISDGLAADLTRLATASGCGASIDLDRLPLSEALRGAFGRDECRYLALNGGDDYELCFAVPADRQDAFEAWSAQQATPVARIGVLEVGTALSVVDGGRVVSLPATGFDHFAEDG